VRDSDRLVDIGPIDCVGWDEEGPGHLSERLEDTRFANAGTLDDPDQLLLGRNSRA